MSYDNLLLNRPQYFRKNNSIVSTHVKTTSHLQLTTDYVSPISSPKLPLTASSQKKVEIKKIGEINSIHRQNQQQKKQRILDAYNGMSDFTDKKQIVVALKSLLTADERIQLIDKILERKEEMQLATLKLKAKKLEPIFNIIRRKLRSNKQHQTYSPNSQQHEVKDTVIEQQSSKQMSQPEIKEELTPNQQQIIEKLQARFTTNVAFSWLTNRHENKNAEDQICSSPGSARRQGRRNSLLQNVKKPTPGLKQMFSKKVSENSEEMIRLGKLKAAEHNSKQVNMKELIGNAKAKVDSRYVRLSRNDHKKTLNYVSNERSETAQINDEYVRRQNQLIMRRQNKEHEDLEQDSIDEKSV